MRMIPCVNTNIFKPLRDITLNKDVVCLINCNKNGIDIIKTFEGELRNKIAYIPFVSPGYGLSYLISKEQSASREKSMSEPQIFFLENHFFEGFDGFMTILSKNTFFSKSLPPDDLGSKKFSQKNYYI
jgi:hypothetical protein